MQLIHHSSNIYLLRFDAGDEMISGIAQFCVDYGIEAGSLTALGSARETVLAYYNLDTKEYEDTTINERVEVIGVVGNISVKDGETIVHAHGTIADRTLTPRAGHIQKCVVSATMEVTLWALDGRAVRAEDRGTGLSLLRA